MQQGRSSTQPLGDARLGLHVTPGLIGGGLVALLSVLSCREPTSILIEARTNVSYQAGYTTAFTVGAPGAVEDIEPTTVSDAAWSSDGFVGSLTTVPSSSDTAIVALKVVLGVRKDSRACAAPAYEGCIVARRRIRYVEHQRLRLPVTLYASCEGVPCEADSTCNYLGQCVSALVDPSTCDSSAGCQIPEDRPDRPPLPVNPTDAGSAHPVFGGASQKSGRRRAPPPAQSRYGIVYNHRGCNQNAGTISKCNHDSWAGRRFGRFVSAGP